MKYCLKEPEALYDFITGTLKPVSYTHLVGIANALEVSTDTLLNRQLTGAPEMSNAEAQKIFANCPPYETYVLLDVLKTTKNALRSHHHLLKDEWLSLIHI